MRLGLNAYNNRAHMLVQWRDHGEAVAKEVPPPAVAVIMCIRLAESSFIPSGVIPL